MTQSVPVRAMMESRPRPRFSSLIGRRTAHLAIDLQVGFLERGAPFEVAAARAIVPAVNRVSAALRAAGGLNIFLRYTIDPDEPQRWTSYQELMPAAQRALSAEAFRRGAPTHALWPELDVGAGDLIMDKTRLSAFIPGTCDAQAVLAARGIDTLIISGCLTDGCCESTARDAAQMSYRVFFPEDGNASWSEEGHQATLRTMSRMAFADVSPVDEMLALMAGTRDGA
ncbi:isochorismatase [Rhizorhabdus wittichii DC-6]|nr:isochorismatase [Rhizorhabdus wittichii DC-6]